MDNYTDQDESEALKRWWQENGRAAIAGLVLGVGAVLGWQAWGGYRESVAEEASQHYQTVLSALQQGSPEAARDEARILREDYAGSPYAAAAALALAAQAANREDLEAAAAQLEWVAEQASEPAVRELASLRLAQVLFARGQPEAALQRLDGLSEASAPRAEELRGDILRAQGDLAGAATAYRNAQVASFSTGREDPWLQMKLDDLPRSEAVE